MSRLWEALSNPETREVVAWIGGGLCVAVSALWTAYLRLGARPASAEPPPPITTSASADRSGLAAGRDVIITSHRIPLAVWVLGAGGLALLALAYLMAGDTLDCSAKVEGGMENSRIEIRGAGC